MSNLDLAALKKAEEDLKSKGGNGIFTRLAKEETKDIRILDPTPSMNGLYYAEIPTWWINGKPVISPEFAGEGDVTQVIIDDFKADFMKDPDGEEQFNKLLNATKGQGMKLLSKSDAYWIPILEFDWTIKNNQIVGITDDKDEYDVSLIKKFVKDGKPKIFDVKMSLLKDINAQLTTGRAGATFLDPEKGYNLLVRRAGDGRDTKYTAQRDEQMPMPEEFYGEGTPDVVEVAKSMMFSDKYIEDLLANYFYGEQLPEEPEYRYPELREKLKSEDSGETTSRRSRPGRGAATEEKVEEKATEEKAEKPTTRGRSRGAEVKKEEPQAGRGRSRRSLVDDVDKGNNTTDD